MDNTNLYWSLLSAAGMMLVAIAAVVFWRRLTRLPYRWFWIATAAHLIAPIVTYSAWWIELALLPMALVSIPILWWCYRVWGRSQEAIS